MPIATLCSFSDTQFNESEFEAQLTDERVGVLVCQYWIIKLQGRFLTGDYAAALAAAQRAKPRLVALTGPERVKTRSRRKFDYGLP